MARWTKRNATGLNAKAQACSVEYLSGYSFRVASPSGNEYRVSLNENLSGGRCTCRRTGRECWPSTASWTRRAA